MNFGVAFRCTLLVCSGPFCSALYSDSSSPAELGRPEIRKLREKLAQDEQVLWSGQLFASEHAGVLGPEHEDYGFPSASAHSVSFLIHIHRWRPRTMHLEYGEPLGDDLLAREWGDGQFTGEYCCRDHRQLEHGEVPADLHRWDEAVPGQFEPIEYVAGHVHGNPSAYGAGD